MRPLPDHPTRPFTRRTLKALHALGLTVCDIPPHDDAARAVESLACELDSALGAGQMLLITGPSGAGKTCTLRAIAARAGEREGVVVITAEPPAHAARLKGTALDALHRVRPYAPGAVALDLLAAAGLADPSVLLTPCAHLSEGQRARLLVARALARAELAARTRSVLLTLDEFGSSLDERTARTFAAALRRRFARAPGNLRVAIAATRPEIGEELRADWWLDLAPEWWTSAQPPVLRPRPPRCAA